MVSFDTISFIGEDFVDISSVQYPKVATSAALHTSGRTTLL